MIIATGMDISEMIRAAMREIMYKKANECYARDTKENL